MSHGTFGGWDQSAVITPDGSRVVYTGNGSTLFVRALDTLEPVLLYTSAGGGRAASALRARNNFV